MVTLYRLALLLLAFQCCPAHALIPKVSVTMYTMGGSNPKYSTPEAVCNYGYNATSQVCLRSDGTFAFAVYKVIEFQCPANSHESSLTCACNDGYVEGDDGQSCEAAPVVDPCELLADMCSGSAGMSNNFSMDGKKAGISFTCMAPVSVGIANPLPGCNKGCMAAVGGFTTAIQSSEGKWVTQGSAKYVGSTCDPNVIDALNREADPEYVPEENPKTTPESDKSCPNGFPGQVDGVTVCVPPKASSGVTETETKDNGDGTKTNSKTEVKCENGKCEVTKTSTTTNTTNNSTVNSSSTTTTVDKGDYCSKNASAAVCKNEKGEEEGKGKFGGSCSGGFTCEGDALQCAIAKEQHKRSCELHVNESPESKLYEASKGKTGKVTDDLPGNETIALTDRINTSSALGAGYCPLRDVTVDVAGYSKVLPLSNSCEQLGYVKTFFVGLCLLLALWIVFGRK